MKRLLLAVAFSGIPAQLPACAARSSDAHDRLVAVTIDDLPGMPRGAALERLQDMNRRLLAALRAEGVPAVGFVNEQGLDVDGEREARIGILRDWLDAGMDLGNHTFAHRSLTRTPLRDYELDVIRGEEVIRPLLESRGRRLRYFRHPFTHTGPTREIKGAFERFLDEHGYVIAPFTVEDADYVFAALYQDALERQDREAARRVQEEYLAHQERMFDWFESPRKKHSVARFPRSSSSTTTA
jgi:peptidoglycan/xylan/chitin deacetylase (PgdA/CDA1 family)